MSNQNDNGPRLLAQVRAVMIAKTQKAYGVSGTGKADDIVWVPRSMVAFIGYPERDFPEVVDITMDNFIAVKAKLIPPMVETAWGAS